MSHSIWLVWASYSQHIGRYLLARLGSNVFISVYLCAVCIWSRLDGWVCRPEALAPHQTVADRLAYIYIYTYLYIIMLLGVL